MEGDTLKKVVSLIDFKNILPYDSELFGVYQPLLGWKSKRIEERFQSGFLQDRGELLGKLRALFQGSYTISNPDGRLSKVERIGLGQRKSAVKSFDIILLSAIASQLPPIEQYDDKIWQELLEPRKIDTLLNTHVIAETTKWYDKQRSGALNHTAVLPLELLNQALEKKVNQESVAAATLIHLAEHKLFAELKQIFYMGSYDYENIVEALSYKDPFETLDPKKDLDRVGLSPIGIVHLFRQYFFEFDTFLGSPVGHVWLSPGASAELFEISTRRSLTERTTETETESSVKSERDEAISDELSDSVKEDNRTDTKFGANAHASESWVWGSAEQSASFDLNTTLQTAREQSHKHMRSQSDKLTTEIRKNYKSTFKTVNEVTDTSSKRYVIGNDTDKLLNYEFRRKMRQVGVQVQDIGTYLCWQTYVDNPGHQLDLSKLVHIAKSPDTDNLPHPETLVAPQAIVRDYVLNIPFIQTSEDRGDLDEDYHNGIETDTDFNEGSKERIESNFLQKVSFDQVGYRLTKVGFDTTGADVQLSAVNIQQDAGSTQASFTAHLDHVNFQNQPALRIMAKLYWEPETSVTEAIAAKNLEQVNQFTARLEQEYRKEFVEAAKERIKLASRIEQRPFDDLREEERIAVYRILIQELLTKGIVVPDARTSHAVAELINSIFDVDKMLYFVAPEWWKPRQHVRQSFGTLKSTGKVDAYGNPEMVPDSSGVLSAEHLVGWDGMKENQPDYYYITEDSKPAKLGSSLGWLLQLDGDNLRNAYLNAPWVKAVIPVRPGKEKAALNWLKQVEGMNGIGTDDYYTGKEPDLQGKTMLEVLEILAEQVKAKHEKSTQTQTYHDPDNPADPDSTVTSTPVDRVYEHGFYALKDGFRSHVSEDFEVFDQWVEVLPTDQVVPVEVSYDPKTGRQL
jgi:hypothetical protein